MEELKTGGAVGAVEGQWGGESEEKTDGMNVDVLLVGLRCLQAAAF